jgi:hypothetical protein
MVLENSPALPCLLEHTPIPALFTRMSTSPRLPGCRSSFVPRKPRLISGMSPRPASTRAGRQDFGRPSGVMVVGRPLRPRLSPIAGPDLSAARSSRAGASRLVGLDLHPCSGDIRRHRGSSCCDPRRLPAAWRVLGRGRAAPAVPRHHRQRAGADVGQDHRWLEAARSAAAAQG